MRTALHAAAPGVLLYQSLDGPAAPGQIDAVFESLAPWWRPLQIEVELMGARAPFGTVTRDLPVRARNHRVRLAGVDHVSPRARLGSPEDHDLSNESLTVGQWLQSLLAREEPHVIWHHLVVTAAAVRAPEIAVPSALKNLEGVVFPVEIQDGMVSGPVSGSSIDPPIRLELLHQGHELELQLRVVWPLWSSEPGKSDFVRAVGRLADLGWTVEEADPGYAPA